MTHEEIHALSDLQLHNAIVRELGGGWLVEPGAIWESLNICHAAEDRLKEMGLAEEFLESMKQVASFAQEADGMRHGLSWYIVHTGARQRAEAILATVQGKE